MVHDISGYRWGDASPSCSHAYLYPMLCQVLSELANGRLIDRRLLDLGCGNGSLTARLHELGWSVVGADPSEEGIRRARTEHPSLDFRHVSAYDDLRSCLGTFPVVTSLEVIEHLYSPRDFVSRIFEALEADGTLILSTPYHGYLKNVLLALSGRLDAHFTALWDHGHIKFWSIRTLTRLLWECGFQVDRVVRVGRIPPLANSMLVVASKRRELWR